MKTFKDYLAERYSPEDLKKRIMTDAEKNSTYIAYAYAIFEECNFHQENEDMLKVLNIKFDKIRNDYSNVNHSDINSYVYSTKYIPDFNFIFELLEKGIDKKQLEKLKSMLK